MLAQLVANADGLPIATTECTMMEFLSSGDFDLALSVFTVLLYITDEADLQRSFAAARQSLRESGRMLIDVPSPQLFRGFEVSDETFSRRVHIQPEGGNRYIYQEEIMIKSTDGDRQFFRDSFPIRKWHPEEVMDAAHDSGLKLEKELSDSFIGSGSRYFLLRPK